MRHASDALLTGIGTILADNPLLTDRSGLHRRRRLRRVILDTKLRLPLKSRIVENSRRRPSGFYCRLAEIPEGSVNLQNAGVELVHLKPREGKLDLNAVLKELGRREILSVLLEAGPRLNAEALAEGIVNRMVFFTRPSSRDSPRFPLRRFPLQHCTPIRLRSFQQFGPDLAAEFILHE